MTSKFKGKKPALDSDKTAKGSNAVMLRLAPPWLAMIATIREGVNLTLILREIRNFRQENCLKTSKGKSQRLTQGWMKLKQGLWRMKRDILDMKDLQIERTHQALAPYYLYRGKE